MSIREQDTVPLSPPKHKKTRASLSANSRFKKYEPGYVAVIETL